MSQDPSLATIVLIEADPSLQRLIMLGLQHGGMHVVAAPSLETLSVLELPAPDLLVLDMDADWSVLEKVRSVPQLAALPLVVLTWDAAALPVAAGPSSMLTTTTDTIQPAFLDKPFDARALYQTIKQLLSQRAAARAASVAEREAAVMATYTRHTRPSLWPIITAAGLLLTVIGLLCQIVVMVIGLLIVAVALLLWTTGPRAEPQVALNVSRE